MICWLLRIRTLAVLPAAAGCLMALAPAAWAMPADRYCRELHVPLAATAPAAPQAWLGVAFEPATPQAAAPSSCPQLARVTAVIKGSAARQAGLQKDDLILSLDGAAVCVEDAPAGPGLRAALGRRQVGEQLEVGLLRAGQRLERPVRLGTRPRQHAAGVLRAAAACPTGPSRLQRLLEQQQGSGRFARVVAGLADRVDQLHNLATERPELGNPLQRREFTSLMRQPLLAAETVRILSEPFLATGETAGPATALPLLAALADLAGTPSPPPREVTLPALLAALETAATRTSTLLAQLSADERELLRSGALDNAKAEDWNRFVAAAHKFDLAALVEALAPLTAFLTDNNLARLRQDLLERFPEPASGPLYRVETSAGPVLVGGPGNDRYDDDAALILELGGDDLYRNNAGGSRAGMPVALVIDWAGDDRYLTSDNVSQGAGLLGSGLLIDLAGRDLFSAGDGSQGAGLFGIGILHHAGGQATFRSRRFAQGTGVTGLGLLSTGRGDTLYQGGEKGQGFGAFGGVGVLCDGDGNDTYQLGGLRPDFRDPQRATVSMGQGFGYGIRPDGELDGISGGIGLLLDGGGDDRYLADYFAQGAAYYFGLGMLRDLAGNDHYLAGRYAQGAGIHASVGVLSDEQGDDSYLATTGVSQGLGHDYGVGFLADQGGDDRYDGGSLVQGAATGGGLGLLFDAGGHDDFSAREKGMGFARDETGMGILLTPLRQTLSPGP